MDDSELVALFFARDERAIESVAQKYGAFCRNIAAGILEDPRDREECVSDTWLRVWNSIPPERSQRLELYLAKIVRNLALTRIRYLTAAKRSKNATQMLDELEYCVDGTQNVESEMAAKELRQAIDRFLDSLPNRDKTIFLCRYYFAQPVGIIAEKMRMREQNVTLILFRTRKKLKSMLEKEGLIDEKR